MNNFYDKMAKEFGGYGFSTSKPKYHSRYPNGNPEAIFKEKLLELATPDSIAADMGCGDGKFTFEIADHFFRISGLDSSKELIAIAQQKKKTLNVKNVSLFFGDASKTSFDDQSFDIIFNRRGPSYYTEYSRLLKPGGYYLEIGIGEQDAVSIKKIFGRGQNYGVWNSSRLEADKPKFEALGMELIVLKDYIYSENYLSKEDFILFLKGVPIFEDFNLDKDKKYLDAYFKNNIEGVEVRLARHRVVYVLKKQLFGQRGGS